MIVYRITCRVTGKSYIGATHLALKRRLGNHKAAAKAGGLKGRYPLSVAIREHGWDAFEVDVLAHPTSYAELAALEQAAIQLFHTQHPDGYNLLAGRWKPGTKTGRAAWNRGRKHTAESKAKMSAQRQGKDNARARMMRFNDVTYACIQDCCDATGLTREQLYRRFQLGLAQYVGDPTPGKYGPQVRRPISDATRQKMSLAHSGAKHYRARRIAVNGVEYPSIKDAEGVSGFTRMQLRLMLKQGTAQYLSESHYIVPPPVTANEQVFVASAETRARMSEKKRAWWAALSPDAKRAYTERMHPHLKDKESTSGND